MVGTANPRKVITGKVRLSYVHLFEPWSNNDSQDKKYSVALLIPKSDKATAKKLHAAQAAALAEGKDSVFKGKPPRMDDGIANFTIKDGDEHEDLAAHPEYAGHWYMSVSSKTKPGVVDGSVQPILDASEVYSGCYARVSLGAFAYNTQGNKGVSFGLNHVQKIADGEPLGNVSRAEDDFDEVDDDEGDDLI